MPVRTIGLGTSTSAEAKEYFSNLQTHEIDFMWDDKVRSEPVCNVIAARSRHSLSLTFLIRLLLSIRPTT